MKPVQVPAVAGPSSHMPGSPQAGAGPRGVRAPRKRAGQPARPCRQTSKQQAQGRACRVGIKPGFKYKFVSCRSLAQCCHRKAEHRGSVCRMQPAWPSATSSQHLKADEEGARHGPAALQHPTRPLAWAHSQAGVGAHRGGGEEAAPWARPRTPHQLWGGSRSHSEPFGCKAPWQREAGNARRV